MTKRSDQTETTTKTAVDTAAEKVLRLRTGKTIGDDVEVGPPKGLSVEAQAELERIQTQVLASYGYREDSRTKVVARLKNLEED
jgi:hypothetical protein